MATTTDTVTTLNRMAGKTNTRTTPATRTASKLNPEDIEFPSTKRRQSGRLQPLQKPAQRHNVLRRNSFSIPENDDDARTSTDAVPKKKRKIITKSKQSVDESPLKTLGFDLDLPLPDKRINFNDSPARNLRARKHNSLETLKTLKPQGSQISSQGSLRRSTRLSIHNGTAESLVEPLSDESRPVGSKAMRSRTREKTREEWEEERQQEDGNEDQEEGGGAGGGDEDGREENTGEDEEDDRQASMNDQQTQNITEDGGQQASQSRQDENGDLQDKPASRSEKRPRVMADVRNARTERQATTQNRDRNESERQIEEDEEKEKDEAIRRFMRGIDEFANVNCQHHLWASIGYVSAVITDTYSGTPESARGRALNDTIKKLMEVYTELYGHNQPDDGKIDAEVSKYLSKLEGLCQTLYPTNRREEDLKLVRELYKYIIPKTTRALKRFVKLRYHKEPFKGNKLREFDRLISIAVRVCNAATSWKPRPADFEGKIKAHVRGDMYPSLKVIQAQFAIQLRAEEQQVREEKAIQKLDALQEAARRREKEFLAQRVSSRTWAASAWMRAGSEKEVRRDARDDVFDIDDLELDGSESVAAQGSKTRADGREQIQRPHFQRQHTEEIPPPPFDDWSEEENAALLNGLQQFKSGNRYGDILHEFDVLRDRDIDDLISQARYFKQVMMPHPDVEQLSQSLGWLFSVE